MVRDTIKIFARLKREENIISYRIEKAAEHEDLILYANHCEDIVHNKHLYDKFRKVFYKVFDQTTGQEQIFEDLAKPIVKKVLCGYNGTIFAYGQTGTGKTYTITGSPSHYDERGLIPRSIQAIFSYINKSDVEHSVYISYLEIYKEIGYDLLNPKQHANTIEEFPRVVLLEDSKGEAHLRNLSMLQVSTEEEAMKLLFIGDTNKTMAETPMNDSSSRSHCVFTIYVASREADKTVKRSKLHLVDLAGSERIYKSNINGATLSEAKHINLSLHYLEQVILALSQSTRTHIPFRNSMMTYVLRDSLNGNSVTAMLATLTLSEVNLEETISTCKFAQRVAMINTSAIMNEFYDPVKEVCLLKKEIQELRQRLLKEKSIETVVPLSIEQKTQCKSLVREYLDSTANRIEVPPDMESIQYCFKLLKVAVRTYEKQNKNLKGAGDSHEGEIIKYKLLIEDKDREIDKLKKLINKQVIMLSDKLVMEKSTAGWDATLDNLYLTTDSEFSPRSPCSDYKGNALDSTNIKHCVKALCSKYELANNYTVILEQCKQNIVQLKNKIHSELDGKKMENFTVDLANQQNLYKEFISKLTNLKKNIDVMKNQLKKCKQPKVRKHRNRFSGFAEHQNSEDLKESFNVNTWETLFENNKRKCTSSDLPPPIRKHKKPNLWRNPSEIIESTESTSEPNSANSTPKDFTNNSFDEHNTEIIRDKTTSIPSRENTLSPIQNIPCDSKPVINLFDYKSYRLHISTTPNQPDSADSGFRDSSKSRGTPESSIRATYTNSTHLSTTNLSSFDSNKNPVSIHNQEQTCPPSCEVPSYENLAQKQSTTQNLIPKQSRNEIHNECTPFDYCNQGESADENAKNAISLPCAQGDNVNIQNSTIEKTIYTCHNVKPNNGQEEDLPMHKVRTPFELDRYHLFSKKPDNLKYKSTVTTNSLENDCKETYRIYECPNNFKVLNSEDIIPLITVSTPFINSPNSRTSRKIVNAIETTRTDNNQNLPKTTSHICFNRFFKSGDPPELIEFVKTIPLTNDPELDEEIVRFYRNKFDKTV